MFLGLYVLSKSTVIIARNVWRVAPISTSESHRIHLCAPCGAQGAHTERSAPAAPGLRPRTVPRLGSESSCPGRQATWTGHGVSMGLLGLVHSHPARCLSGLPASSLTQGFEDMMRSTSIPIPLESPPSHPSHHFAPLHR